MVKERHVLRCAALFGGCRHTAGVASASTSELLNGGAAVKRSWPEMIPITGPWYGRSVAKHRSTPVLTSIVVPQCQTNTGWRGIDGDGRTPPPGAGAASPMVRGCSSMAIRAGDPM